MVTIPGRGFGSSRRVCRRPIRLFGITGTPGKHSLTGRLTDPATFGDKSGLCVLRTSHEGEHRKLWSGGTGQTGNPVSHTMHPVRVGLGSSRRETVVWFGIFYPSSIAEAKCLPPIINESVYLVGDRPGISVYFQEFISLRKKVVVLGDVVISLNILENWWFCLSSSDPEYGLGTHHQVGRSNHTGVFLCRHIPDAVSGPLGEEGR